MDTTDPPTGPPATPRAGPPVSTDRADPPPEPDPTPRQVMPAQHPMVDRHSAASQPGAAAPRPSTDRASAATQHPAANQHVAANQHLVTDRHDAANQHGAADQRTANQHGAADSHGAANWYTAANQHVAANEHGAADQHPAGKPHVDADQHGTADRRAAAPHGAADHHGETGRHPVTDWNLAAERLVAAGRRLAAGGLVTGTAGNLSLRVAGDVLVTGSGTVLGELTPADLTLVSPTGEVLAGDPRPTSELPLHLAVYRAFPSVGAVAHAHAPASVAVGLTHDVLPPVHYLTVRLGGVVRVADYATFGSPELAAAVVAGLEGRSAVLMRNHGSVAHGTSIEQACERLELVEWLADVYARAVALGTPRLLSDAELAAADATFIRLDYGSRSYTPPC